MKKEKLREENVAPVTQNFARRFMNAIFLRATFSTLKVGLLHSKKICFICLNERSLKMIKNAFYFILKALSILKIFKFCLDFLVMKENGSIRKIRLISKFMTSQLGS